MAKTARILDRLLHQRAPDPFSTKGVGHLGVIDDDQMLPRALDMSAAYGGTGCAACVQRDTALGQPVAGRIGTCEQETMANGRLVITGCTGPVHRLQVSLVLERGDLGFAQKG